MITNDDQLGEQPRKSVKAIAAHRTNCTEFRNAIDSMKNENSAGHDDIPEFDILENFEFPARNPGLTIAKNCILGKIKCKHGTNSYR